MPGLALVMRSMLPAEYGAVLGSFATYMAYAMVSSGHLPLMLPMLLLAFLAEGLVTIIAWADGCFQVVKLENVAALED